MSVLYPNRAGASENYLALQGERMTLGSNRKSRSSPAAQEAGAIESFCQSRKTSLDLATVPMETSFISATTSNCGLWIPSRPPEINSLKILHPFAVRLAPLPHDERISFHHQHLLSQSRDYLRKDQVIDVPRHGTGDAHSWRNIPIVTSVRLAKW